MPKARQPISLRFPNAGVRATSVAPVSFNASSGEIDVTWFTDPDAVLRDDLGQAFIERLHIRPIAGKIVSPVVGSVNGRPQGARLTARPTRAAPRMRRSTRTPRRPAT